MPTLEDAKGNPVSTGPVDAQAVNQAFAAAMADDGPDTQSPPKRANVSRETEPQPKRRGRPPKAEQARTVAAPVVTLDDKARANGVQGLAQIGAGLALMLGKATGSLAYQADAMTIAAHAPAIADACVQIAKSDAAFAARLDKICASGPYAALVSVGVSMGLQCLRNHKPAMQLPGTVHPDQLLTPSEEIPDASAVAAVS
jgi:hypothetical protein